MRKKSFVPPSLTDGKNFLASPPAVAKTIAEDRTALPPGEVAKSTAFLDNELNALFKLPSRVSLITPPVFNVPIPTDVPWLR